MSTSPRSRAGILFAALTSFVIILDVSSARVLSQQGRTLADELAAALRPVLVCRADDLDRGNKLEARIVKLTKHRDPWKRVEFEVFLRL